MLIFFDLPNPPPPPPTPGCEFTRHHQDDIRKTSGSLADPYKPSEMPRWNPWAGGGVDPNYIPPRKSNIDTKNDGFKNVSPFKYLAIFGIHVSLRGCTEC